MNNFQFSNKSFSAVGTLCVLGIIFILAMDNNSFGWGFILGAIAMTVATAYTPAAKSNQAQAPTQTQPKTTQNTNSQAQTSQDTGDIKTLFVGNLAFKANRHELNKLFSEHGHVHSVRLMTDRQTRKPRGFGFVEMAAADAPAAIEALNDYEFFGRQLRVNEANERKPKDAS